MAKLIRGTSKNARFFVVDSTDIVQEALDIHKAKPTAITAFGRLLTAGVMMGATLKGDDLLTIRTDTDGPLNHMAVTTDGKHGIKGYMSNPGAENEKGFNSVGSLVGKGMLRVIKDMGLKEPYVGISDVRTGEIGQDVAYYYASSEQTPSVVSLGVTLNPDMTVKSAGGYMIQLMPGATEEFIEKIERKVSAIRSINELFEGGMDLERVAKLLYEDMDVEEEEALIEDYQVLDTTEFKYVCNCEKDKFYRGLITLGKAELGDIFKTQDIIETECHFCKKSYKFGKEDFFKN